MIDTPKEPVAVEGLLAYCVEHQGARPRAQRGGHSHLVAVLPGDQRSPSQVRVGPGTDAHPAPRARHYCDQRVGHVARRTTEIAMHRSPADPYPADTAASAAMPQVHASGSTTVVLGAAERHGPLAVRRARLVDVAGDRRGADG